MPQNKSAIIRYQTLDRCFSDLHRKYYLNDLMEECQEALQKLYNTKETISKRTIYYDVDFMMSEDGYRAPIKRYEDGRKVYFRYTDSSFSINRTPLNDTEISQLKEAFGLMSRLSGRHEFSLINELLPKIENFLDLDLSTTQPIISYDENKYLKNQELLGDIFNAIRDKKVLEIKYKSFKSTGAEKYTLHPYFLKQYNGRWYVFGLCAELYELQNINPINFALDRIEKMRNINLPYIDNLDIDFNSYFDDIIGVTKPSNAKLEKISIRVSPSRKPYIETKPLHGSQKRFKPQGDAFITSIEVIPNFELYTLLLSLSPDVEVLEPDHIRLEVKKVLVDSMKNYID